LWWYVRWVQTRRRTAYVASLLAYALGLMTKPMLVTVPLTLLVQRAAGAVDVRIPPVTRLENALVAYVGYVGVALWPTRLAVYYPLAASLPAWKPIAAAFGLVVATVAVLRSSRPYLVTGWLCSL